MSLLASTVIAQMETRKPLGESHQRCIELSAKVYDDLLSGKTKGKFCLCSDIGSGKTLTIKNLLLLLANGHWGDKSVCVAVERHEQIDDIEEFLEIEGVPKHRYAIVDSRDYKSTKADLEEVPIVICTHARIGMLGFAMKHFTYKGKPRDLLIYDEELSKSCCRSDELKKVLNQHSDLIYELNQGIDTSRYHNFHKYRYELRKYFEKYSEILNKRIDDVIDVSELKNLPILDGPSQHDVWEISREIRKILILKDDEINWLEILMKASNHKMAIKKDSRTGSILFSASELLGPEVTNLVTTDATRIYSGLHKDSSVKMVQLPRPRTYENLTVHHLKLRSGQDFVKKNFESIVELTVEVIKRNEELGKPVPTLVFYSQKLEIVPGTVKNFIFTEAISRGIFSDLKHFESRVKFCTYGKHNFTNEYIDCTTVVFMGLWRKPDWAYIADVYKETMDIKLVTKELIDEAKNGHVNVVMNQAIGRGCVRRGEPMDVYFFDKRPETFLNVLREGFLGLKSLEWAPESEKVLEIIKRSHPGTEEEKSLQHKEDEKVRNFRKACVRRGVKPTKALITEYMESGLTPVKFLNSKGYR